mmetsp:Transcript_22689/g.49332  ORF Transcript_22689/g.49332 Transcript_22689/m.49332 type:complete len:208 (+) Transcript_22689:2327-2950(+)
MRSTIQGQVLFSTFDYYFVASSINDLHPEFDKVILEIQQVDPASMFVFVLDCGESKNVAVDQLANRLKAANVEWARIKLFTSMQRLEYVHLPNNMNVILDPFPSRAQPYVQHILEALDRNVPVVSSRYSIIRDMCTALKISEFCLSGEGDPVSDYVDRAVKAPTRLTTLDSKFRSELAQAKKLVQVKHPTSWQLIGSRWNHFLQTLT